MSESNQVSDELFDAATEKPEIKPDLESSEDAEKVEKSDEAEEAEPGENKAELERQRAIRSTKRKIEDGLMTLDDIKHPWLRKAILEDSKPKADISSEIQKAIRAEKENERYESARARLNELGLTKERREKVSELNRLYLGKGLSKADALETALGLAGVKLEEPDRYAARLPKPSHRKVASEDGMKVALESGEYPSDIPLDKRVEYLERLRNPNRFR